MSMHAAQHTNDQTLQTSATIEVRNEGECATVEEAERRAKQLRKEGEKILEQTEEQMKKAKKAQAAAAAMAEQANRITEEALMQQIEGQEKLAMAAQKMMEAGQKMQQEVQSMTVTEVPYNVHQTTEVRQQTVTTGQVIQDTQQNVFVSREAEVKGFQAGQVQQGQKFEAHHQQQQQQKGGEFKKEERHHEEFRSQEFEGKAR